MDYKEVIDKEEGNRIVVAESVTATVTSLQNRIIEKVQEATEIEDLYDCLSILQRSNMPCGIDEDEIDAEIDLAMKSGNASQAEVNRVFSRWMH